MINIILKYNHYFYFVVQRDAIDQIFVKLGCAEDTNKFYFYNIIYLHANSTTNHILIIFLSMEMHPAFTYFVSILNEPQAWKPSRGVVCYVQSE